MIQIHLVLVHNPADVLIGQYIQADIHVVLVFQTEFQNVKLKDAYNAHDDFLHAAAVFLENLYGSLLCDLLNSLYKLFPFHGIQKRHTGKMLRRKGRDSLKAEFLSGGAYGVADGKEPGIENADDIAGICLRYHVSVVGHHLLGLQKPHFSVALHMVDFFVGIKFSGADPHKSNPVAVVFVHVGLNFEHKGGKIRIRRVDQSAVRHPGKGRTGHFQEVLQEGFYAEIGQCRPEENRREFALVYFRLIEFHRCPVQEFNLFLQLGFLIFRDDIQQMRIIEVNLLLNSFPGSLQRVSEGENPPGIAVINPTEILAGSDRPVDRAGGNSQFLFNLIHQVKGVSCVPVQLIDKGKNRNVAHGADLEQFSCLSLHALAAVDDHNGRIRRHKGPVGVLGEVLVSGRIQNVDTVTVVQKLEHRGGDRDTPLFFNFHPVGNRVAGSGLPLYGTSLIQYPSVKKKFFGKCCFSGIRMRDNGECPTSFNFSGIISHVCLL